MYLSDCHIFLILLVVRICCNNTVVNQTISLVFLPPLDCLCSKFMNKIAPASKGLYIETEPSQTLIKVYCTSLLWATSTCLTVPLGATTTSSLTGCGMRHEHRSFKYCTMHNGFLPIMSTGIASLKIIRNYVHQNVNMLKYQFDEKLESQTYVSKKSLNFNTLEITLAAYLWRILRNTFGIYSNILRRRHGKYSNINVTIC